MAGAETASLPLAGRAPGIALALASMTTIQLGAALSEPLFDRVGPAGLRLLLGFVILGQGLALSGIAAIAMVVLASTGATLGSSAEPPPPDEPVHPA